VIAPLSHEQLGLAGIDKPYHSAARGQKRGDAIMRLAKRGLAVLFGFLAMLSVGVGEAKSQSTVLRVCNRSPVEASVTVVSHPYSGTSSFVIKGWWTVKPRTCVNTESVPSGWVYFYADSDSGDEWRGNSERFCVTYPGPFERTISAEYNCSGSILKSFSGFYVDGGTFTWNLN